MAPDSFLIPAVFFITGACVGSFLNVCIFRIPEKISIVFPGSKCPSCERPIPFYCNIPVLSYLFLGGKCLYCKTRISPRYPLIEALTGMAALALYFKFGLLPEVFFWFSFISTLIVITFIDIDHQIIPDVISLPGIIIFSSSVFFVPEMTIKEVLGGIFTGGGLLYAVALGYYLIKRRQGMGGGDIKLLAMIGAATGVQGVLFTIFAGSLLGTLGGGAAILISKEGNRWTRIPFGPYLASGAVLYIFYGPMLINWYMGLLAP